MKRFFGLLAMVLALACIWLSPPPLTHWLEARLKAELAARGMEGVSFTLASISPREAVITQIETTKPLIARADRLIIDWQGKWSLEGVQLPPGAVTLPPLSAAGAWQWKDRRLSLQGEVASADKTHKAVFNLADNVLAISRVQLPWNGGVIRVREVKMNLAKPGPITLPLVVERVPLNALFALVVEGKAEATGLVSGTLPVVIEGRSFTIKAGKLSAVDQGTIRLSPDMIPESNEQMALVRQVLGDFHYHQFAMSLESDKDKKLSMLLQLSGNNPEVYNGREIKLNVRLQGDLLSLIEQSMMPMTDPKQWLEQ